MTKRFTLTLHELPKGDDTRFSDFLGTYDLKPRPLGDKILQISDIQNHHLGKIRNGEELKLS